MIARIFSSRQHRELTLIAGLALVCLAFSAHAALRAIRAHGLRPSVAAPSSVGPRTSDPLPDTAKVQAADDDAAPAAGTTGTAALPDLPVPASAGYDVDDGTVHPARAFSIAGASAIDRVRALQCLASAIYYEAASQSDDGQRAVAQVVLNRVMHPAFPDTVCGVVYQGSDRATGCQFSFACDGAMARAPVGAAWDKALRFAAQALAGYVFAPVGLATHYHTYAVTPAWNRQLIMTDAIGAHFFHRWAGYWGTPAAFNQIYRGGEPLPGPIRRTATPDSTPTLEVGTAPSRAPAIDTANAPAAKPEPVALAMVQPAYAESGALKSSVAATPDGLPQSQVLDKWKDSGRPLQ